jgi:hypothetical protein
MKLLHLSDIHLTAPGSTIGGRDPRVNFERALAHALNDHHDAELMVITGDSRIGAISPIINGSSSASTNIRCRCGCASATTTGAQPS